MDEQLREKINLNRADEAELGSLPGIGPKLAEQIIVSRQRFGRFRQTADVVRVKGISETLYSQIAELVYVDPPPEEAALEVSVAEPGAILLSIEKEADAEEEIKPIVFHGEARHLQGIIPLKNVGIRRMVSVALPLEENELRTANGAPLTEIVARHRLPPGQRVRTHVSLALDSRTPPGIYETKLALGEEQYPVIFQVAESLDVDIVPRQFILSNAPGSTVVKTVYVTNKGNVSIQVGDINVVGLSESNQLCRAIRNAIDHYDRTGIDEAVNKLADELEKTFDRSGTLTIQTKEKPITIPPGETVSLELEITLPNTLRKNRRYRGRYHLYNDSISILLQPVETMQEQD